jgi:cell wall-associated NlpC family hydrolase
MSLKKCLLLPFLAIFAISCTSTSINQRYKKTIVKQDSLKVNERFTDANDEDIYNYEFDEEPEEDIKVDIGTLIKNNSNENYTPLALTEREKVMMEIVKYLNTPYQYGGIDMEGIDCSAFTKNVFSKSLKQELPRSSSEQFASGEKIDRNSLKFGDLVFFNTSRRNYPGHVGIYIGEDLFAHASFSQGVTVSSLESAYFKSRYVGARRNFEVSE